MPFLIVYKAKKYNQATAAVYSRVRIGSGGWQHSRMLVSPPADRISFLALAGWILGAESECVSWMSRILFRFRACSYPWKSVNKFTVYLRKKNVFNSTSKRKTNITQQWHCFSLQKTIIDYSNRDFILYLFLLVRPENFGTK